MINVMKIDGYDAVIQYDPEIQMFRGEFTGLNGGADFYGSDIEGLQKEGKLSLEMFLQMCADDGVEPMKQFSGRFNVRISPELHKNLVLKATASGKSINQLVTDSISHSLSDPI